MTAYAKGDVRVVTCGQAKSSPYFRFHPPLSSLMILSYLTALWVQECSVLHSFTDVWGDLILLDMFGLVFDESYKPVDISLKSCYMTSVVVYQLRKYSKLGRFWHKSDQV